MAQEFSYHRKIEKVVLGLKILMKIDLLVVRIRPYSDPVIVEQMPTKICSKGHPHLCSAFFGAIITGFKFNS